MGSGGDDMWVGVWWGECGVGVGWGVSNSVKRCVGQSHARNAGFASRLILCVLFACFQYKIIV